MNPDRPALEEITKPREDITPGETSDRQALIAAIKRALEQADSGNTIPHEVVSDEIAKCLPK